jgi:hypothetical protein
MGEGERADLWIYDWRLDRARATRIKNPRRDGGLSFISKGDDDWIDARRTPRGHPNGHHGYGAEDEWHAYENHRVPRVDSEKAALAG